MPPTGAPDRSRFPAYVPARRKLTGWARDNHVDLTGLEVGSPSLEDAYLALTSEEGALNHG